ncbi:MAG: hypothetical protein NTY67_02660 [Cyanobacteria bacterium]|nr:hypothetical protein [Cyanobacteriota bacterium]
MFTFTGNGNIGLNSLVNSTTFTNNGVTLTIDGLNGGGFRVSNQIGLCAYWAKNNSNNNACDHSPNTGYNGLNFTIGASNKLYNVKLSSFTFGAQNGAGSVNGTFSGASGSSDTFAVNTLTGGEVTNFSTPILANSQNQILLCSTPVITDTATSTPYVCSGNISNSDNTAVNTSLYSIASMTFTYDTPGPLPLLGAGAAFGWSRRLRRRIKRHGVDHSD